MSRPPRRAGRLGAALVALLALVLLAAPAPASAQEPVPGLVFGPVLDLEEDSPSAYAERLGLPPSLYGVAAGFPLTDDDVAAVRRVLDEVSGLGARALITLEPRGSLADVGPADADRLAEQVAELARDYDVPLLLRFAPEMNAPFRPWGVRPSELVAAFRLVADAVHDASPTTRTVWSPAYGAGYPFAEPEAAPRPGSGDFALLDTDGSGRLDDADDPYGPYWPGADAVDVVGVQAYWFGSAFPFGANEVPPPGALAERLSGRAGFATPGDPAVRDLLRRFDRPVLLETGALHVAAAGGPGPVEVKGSWAQQVADVRRSAPQVEAVAWLEVQREEPAADGALVDWRATATPELATRLREQLIAASVDLGSARAGSSGRTSATATGRDPGTALSPAVSWAVTAAGAAVVLGLLLLGRSRRADRWRYRDDGARDLRIDLLRGVAIVFVVVNHLNVASLWHLLSQEALGPVSGAELFVALSGVVLAVAYRRRVEEEGGGAVTPALLRRARTLYLTALSVMALVYAVGLLPGVDARVVTTFTDQGAGGQGGTTYDLYAGIRGLQEFPVPGYLLRDLLLLRLGPSQFNVVGLYVLLLLVTPLVLRALRRRLLPLVLAVSGGLYVLDAVRPTDVVSSQFQDAFPLLTWQVLFVLGLVAGWYRQPLRAALSRPLPLAGLVLLFTAALAFTWGNPFTANEYDVRLRLLPDAVYRAVYATAFERTTLGVGRLLSVVVLLLVLYAALSAFWVPVSRAVGGFLVPLGQASFYVFVLHVFFVLLVANLPGVDDGGVLVGTLVHAAVLGALWLMVRRRVLFGLVPR